MPAPSPPSAAPPALALRGLRKRYRGGLLARARDVLCGVDLELAAGASLALVGPNGSGKTTCLRVAAGIEPPSAGEALLFGRPAGEPASRRRLGFVPETSPYPGELSVRSALELCGALQGLERSELRARVPAMLARVGLAPHARHALGRLSKGMRRRFALAQAFLHRPALLLLDEPTSGLDAEGFLAFDELLAEARGWGAAVVISAHQLTESTRACERVAVLLAGRVAAEAAPRELAGGALLALYRGPDRRALDQGSARA